MLGENKRSLARHFFSVYDPLTKYSFLLDSGSDVSSLPIDLAKPETKMFKTFKGPTSNANISCVGYVNLVLDVGFSKQFSWKFAVCKSLRQPILGADFLSQHSLLVDSHNCSIPISDSSSEGCVFGLRRGHQLWESSIHSTSDSKKRIYLITAQR